jgi:hypothetical protein
MEKTKVTLSLAESAKQKLESLKARLRKEGVPRGAASESAIMESLIRRADFEALLADFDD